jgi:Winged helix DNA-binding domain
VADLTWKQALAWRMARHRLVERAGPDELMAVAARICGLHAQVMSSAELTLWARIDGLRPGALADALWEQRSLVKLWAMRGTLHLLPASELGTWLAALGTYDHYRKGAWLRGFGVTSEGLDRLVEAIGEALDGEPLTRAELGAEVARITRSPEMAERIEGSWGSFLKPASFQGRLCFGPSAGQKVRFTAPDAWVPGGAVPDADPDEALREITRRYLGAFAPATREDLARWWAVSPARAKAMLTALGDEAVEVDVDDSPGWMLETHATEAARTKPANVARLLPGFDQWVIGASRSAPALLDPEHKARVYRNQGWISPVLLVNGRMEGVWRHERQGARPLVEIEPFGRTPQWVRAQAEAEAKRLGGFLGGEPALTWVRPR